MSTLSKSPCIRCRESGLLCHWCWLQVCLSMQWLGMGRTLLSPGVFITIYKPLQRSQDSSGIYLISHQKNEKGLRTFARQLFFLLLKKISASLYKIHGRETWWTTTQPFPVVFLNHSGAGSYFYGSLFPCTSCPLSWKKQLLEKAGFHPIPMGLCPSRQEGRGTSWQWELLLLKREPPPAPANVQ